LREQAKTLQIRNEALTRSENQSREDAAILQTRNEELDAYAHTVAHDLKNPLSILIATADIITSISNLTRKELKEFLQQIKSTAFEMNNIIDNLLLLSEVRKVEAPTEPIDMFRVVTTVQNRLSYIIKEHRGNLVFPTVWPTAIGYEPWIEEVWSNYISNALKYGGASPCVELGASIQADSMIRFWTRDHGQGIPTEEQSRLFIPFTQLGKAHKQGHGLGLSIVLHIVEKLGGQVGVESEVGKGSLFYFTLPASPT
jgi:two-component system sensor histidine kinase/response regulator